jgi:predicted transposase/invertase (TIGR01784 family)
VQRGRQGNFKERAWFYTSRLISDQAPRGKRSEWAYNLTEVYLIALLEEFTLAISPGEEYLHDICLCNRDTGEIFYDKLGYTYIELSNFLKTEVDLETELDKWLYVLKNMSRMDKIPAYLRKPIFEKLFSIAEYNNLTKEEKTMYDSSLKYKWDNKNVLDYAINEAKPEGKLEEARKIAHELKKEGLAVEFIAKTTELSIEEIENL